MAAILDHPDSPEVVISHNVSLVCSGSGIPLPNVTWSKDRDGDIINSPDSVLLSRVVNATHVTSELTLIAVEQQYTGQYNCTLDNVVSRDTASFYLQVLGMVI